MLRRVSRSPKIDMQRSSDQRSIGDLVSEAVMILNKSVRGFLAVSVAALALTGCNKPEAPVAPPAPQAEMPAPIVDGWAVLPAPAVASATRTVLLPGGGELGMILSCDFRPSKDLIANGFWLKLALELKGANGASLGLDPAATENQTARFAVVRSTGEAGSMSLAISDPTHFVYENNQTNELNQDNNDPAKVELAQKFDLPLSDGRTVPVEMLRDDAGYKAVITQCAALTPK